MTTIFFMIFIMIFIIMLYLRACSRFRHHNILWCQNLRQARKYNIVKHIIINIVLHSKNIVIFVIYYFYILINYNIVK